ncbi:hypothetical protein GCM10009007_03530 [Formosimonas limnophila]|uniref:Uncharacterized protein n=1 Tax=Formosimonas limnophila TaxID=1384487 RepID=A0A8J3CLL3_9BURK|nr:hypothetical protein [Formosimonas limnophila]GHA66347.1 hypothetical protein GCM10009007_03530 [Formosimonas limnophila]
MTDFVPYKEPQQLPQIFFEEKGIATIEDIESLETKVDKVVVIRNTGQIFDRIDGVYIERVFTPKPSDSYHLR